MTTPDLAEVIARCRDALKNAPGHSNTAVRVDDLRTILDAAEAGMRAPKPATKEAVQRIKDMGDERDARIRNEALEEAAKVAEVYISIMEKMGMDDSAFGGLVASGTISEQIRALKEKPNA